MKRFVVGIAITCSLVACGVSQQQEVQMGQEYAQQINAQLPIIQDPEVNRYINVLGDSISRLTSRKDLDWHFFIVDSKEVNAFAVPGGFVYVNRGLIERADKMDEVAGVLGHEIGHVLRRHTIKQMQKGQAANVGITLACVLTGVCNNQAASAAIQVGGGALFARFSRSDEAEADQEGFNNVVRAGISPEGMVSMFQKLLEERKTRPAGVEAWFLTHPLEEDRITAIQARINQLPPNTLASLGTDTRNFHTFKARIQSLPPSPPPRQMQQRIQSALELRMRRDTSRRIFRFMRIALTIAGSDSGGGAGIQADLKTFQRFGVFGTSAVTAITAQNTRGVSRWEAVSADLLRAQIDSVCEDLPPSAFKTGMLGTAANAAAVAAAIVAHSLANYSLDPVMVESLGDVLFERDAIDVIRTHLVSKAFLVTPNVPEAEILVGEKIEDEDGMARAAEKIVGA